MGLDVPRLAEAGIEGLELCVHADDQAERFVREHVVRVEDPTGGYWRLDRQKLAPNDDLAHFALFRFPLLNMTKVEMRKAAREMGVLDIMEATWFYHTPASTEPCGRCAPCVYTIDEGLRDRFPRRALLRYQLRRLEPLSRFVGRALRGVRAPRTTLLRLVGRGMAEHGDGGAPGRR
jgi:7-cyano-7-deazaguanine synthase